MKSLLPIIAGGVLVIGTVGGVLILKNKSPDSPAELIQQEQFNQGQPVTAADETNSVVNIVTEVPQEGVPLPTEADIIRTFFNLIDEGKPDDAVNMMSKAVTDDDNLKQAWAVQFNAFKSAEAVTIEPYNGASWTDTTHIYKVEVTAQMKPESANEVIPYFGWDNGENTRWVTITKEAGLWKIQGIGTGP